MPENQPRDEHAKQLKQSISLTKQLRGWVVSDPSRTEEFVDALNRVTGLRLLSGLWAEAAPEATEAVGAANKLVASRGPVGPYTPLVDAARYFTALVHVARVQAGMGLAEAAGTTVEAAFAWADQLTSSGLADHLEAQTLVWALDVRAGAALAAGDVARANGMADAALVAARGADLSGERTPVLLEALRVDADARWAAQLPDDSINLLREAIGLWDEWTRSDLQQLPRMAKAHLERVLTPALPLNRDLAGRLLARGRGEESLAVHDELTRLEHRTAGRRGDSGRVDLALARASQVWDLTSLGRTEPALRAVEDATGAMNVLLKAEKPVGQHLPTQLVVAASVARAELSAGRTEAAAATIESVHSRLQAHKAIATPLAARAVAAQVRCQVQEARDSQTATETRSQAEALVAELRDALPAAFRELQTAELLATAVRGAQLRSTWPTPHWDVAGARSMLEPAGAVPVVDTTVSDEEALRRIDEEREVEAARRIQAEMLATAERQEREREQAAARAVALSEAERRRAERESAEQAESESAEQAERESAEQEESEAADQTERLRVERQAAEAAENEAAEAAARAETEARALAQEAADAERRAREEAERAQSKRLEREQQERAQAAREAQERAEAELAEAERRAAEQATAAAAPAQVTPVDPLDDLRTAAHRAVASGDKQRIMQTHEQLVAALEPRVLDNPSALGRELVDALERLSDAQGWLRGRTAGRAAKQYAKQWGLH